MNLILASTSPYRAQLLQQLRLPFNQMDPAYGETSLPDELPGDRCKRLATGKAMAVAAMSPPAPYLVIGSDQVASLPSGEVLSKPGDFNEAFRQLKACAGQWVRFETGICLMSDTGIQQVASECFDLRYRALDDIRVTRYLNLDQPWDCAGSIRYESLGYLLVQDTRGRDINTLLGLPLLLLVEMLGKLGIDVLKEIN